MNVDPRPDSTPGRLRFSAARLGFQVQKRDSLVRKGSAARRSSVLRTCLAAVACVAVVAALEAQEFPSDESCRVFVNADLLTMAGDEVEAPTPGQDVLVCGTRIRAVGATGSLTIPEGAAEVDAAGKVMMPGLVDGHVHLFAPLDLQLNLVWGVTTVRNLFGNPMSLGLRESTAAGRLWGPRIVTAGPIVDGDPAVWPGSAAVATAEAARASVEQQVEAGYDFIKVYSLLDPEPFRAAIDAAKEAGLPVGGHVPSSVPLRDAVAAGMDFIEHLTGFLPALQREDSAWARMTVEERRAENRYRAIALQVDGFDSGKLSEVAGWMVEHDVWNIPTFIVIERITASLEQKQEWLASHPQMSTVSGAIRNFWNPSSDFRLQDVSAEDLAARNRSAALHLPIVKALHDAGAELMLGTDTPNPFVFPGYSVHEELQRFVDAGLSPWQALRTATVQPARFFGEEDSSGRIAAGFTADLLLLDANPLEDIANSKKVAGVVSRGRWLDAEALRAMEDRVIAASGNERPSEAPR